MSLSRSNWLSWVVAATGCAGVGVAVAPATRFKGGERHRTSETKTPPIQVCVASRVGYSVARPDCSTRDAVVVGVEVW